LRLHLLPLYFLPAPAPPGLSPILAFLLASVLAKSDEAIPSSRFFLGESGLSD
jgi:hypothetical protein